MAAFTVEDKNNASSLLEGRSSENEDGDFSFVNDVFEIKAGKFDTKKKGSQSRRTKIRNMGEYSHNHVSSINHQQKESNSCCGCYILVISLIFLAVSITIYWRSSFEPISLKELQRELWTDVLNQDPAIEVLVHNLKVLSKYESEKIIICLVGPSGVGKTFATNIIKKHVDSRAVHSFQSKDLDDLVKKHSGIIHEPYSIVILDDLIIADVDKFQNFILSVEKINILILGVFSIQKTDDNLNHSISYKDYGRIKRKLQNYVKFAIFDVLDDEVLRRWLTKYFITHGYDIENPVFEKIMMELLIDHDIKYHGLKGLQAKLPIEIAKHVK